MNAKNYRQLTRLMIELKLNISKVLNLKLANKIMIYISCTCISEYCL